MVILAEQVEGERAARIALSVIAEPDDTVTGRVLARVGAVETLRLIESTGAVPGVDRPEAMLWRERLTARITPGLPRTLDQVQQAGFSTLIPTDRDWPAGVNELRDRSPYMLWTRGDISLLAAPLRERATITGARAATGYGEHVAIGLAANLADDRRIIVAGGAYGIETAAHRGALASGGRTIAVLAGGPDRAYPAGNRDLLERIADTGLLTSELPPGATPTRHRFIARARLLASLSAATVIVEAGARSGSLRTAHEANALGRGVAAIPGLVTTMTSVGPHELIKRGRAVLVAETSDITVLLETGRPAAHSVTQPGSGREFTDRHRPSPDTPNRSL